MFTNLTQEEMIATAFISSIYFVIGLIIALWIYSKYNLFGNPNPCETILDVALIIVGWPIAIYYEIFG